MTLNFELMPPHGGYHVHLCRNHRKRRAGAHRRGAWSFDRQLDSLEKTFAKEAGFTERLYRVRTAKRNPFHTTADKIELFEITIRDLKESKHNYVVVRLR